MPRYLPHFIWLAITCVVLGLSAFFLINDHRFRQSSLPGTATVTSSSSTWHNGEQRFTAWFEWRDPDGKVRTFSESGRYTVGDKFSFRFDPKNPDDRSSGAGRWAGIILGLIGGSFLYLFFKVLWTERAAAKAKVLADPRP